MVSGENDGVAMGKQLWANRIEANMDKSNIENKKVSGDSE